MENRIELINNAVDKHREKMVGVLDYMEWIENRRWNMYTNDGIVVLLPEENPIAAIGTLISLNNNHHILSKKIQMIDMRDSARILIK